MKKTILVFMLFGAHLAGLFAQSGEWTSFSNYTNLGALRAQGSNLWIGSNKAMLKMNIQTHQLTAYTTNDLAISNSTKADMAVDSYGNLWIATSAGLLKHSNGVWTIYSSFGSGITPSFTCINIDSENNIWLGTYEQGLIKFDGSNTMVYNTSNSLLPYNRVTAIGVDNNGLVWAGVYSSSTGCRLVKMEDGQMSVILPVYPNLNSNYISRILFDEDNRMFLGQLCSGLTIYDGTTWTHYTPQNSPIPESYIVDMSFDAYGVLWMVFNEYYLTSYDGVNWQTVSVGNYTLSEIVSDGCGNIWCSNSISLFVKPANEPVSVVPVSTISNINISAVNDVHLSSNNVFWASNGTTLLNSRADSWSNLSFSDIGIPNVGNANIAEPVQDMYGNLWFITTLNSLSCVVKYDGSGSTVYNSSNSSLPSGTITHLTTDPYGNVWLLIGTNIVKFNGTTVEISDGTLLPNYVPNGIISDQNGRIYVVGTNYVYTKDGNLWNSSCFGNTTIGDITVDMNNNIWVCGYRFFAKFNGTNWTTWTLSVLPNMPNVTFSKIAVDYFGNLWLASANGLYRKNLEAWVWDLYTSANSCLFSNTIRDVKADSWGNIWVAVPNQLVRINLQPTAEQDILPTATGINRLSNYPNPFVNYTTITYSTEKQAPVQISIYNPKGQLVRRLVSETKVAGVHQIHWDGTDNQQHRVSAGMYLIRLHTDSGVINRKTLLLKK